MLTIAAGAAGGGTNRVAALFDKIQRRPISRHQVQAVAQQSDYMRRIRRNGGARDILAPQRHRSPLVFKRPEADRHAKTWTRHP
ncbi:NaeI family type II restriction endonuclease [Rhizobium sp. WSM1325]|uniref:NaeI family type II restriction endonuclease n=1 Tax=Rhizobium sp. WSM1325 TaxID=3444086 RepID=UPI0013E28966